MTHNTPDPKDLYRIRLEARKKRLESDVEAARMRIQNNVRYAVRNAPGMIGTTVTQAISERNPVLGRLVGRLGFGAETADVMTADRGTARRFGRPDVQKPRKRADGKWISLAEKLVLPLALTLGQRQLMALGLRGGGKLIGSALRWVTRGFWGKKRK